MSTPCLVSKFLAFSTPRIMAAWDGKPRLPIRTFTGSWAGTAAATSVRTSSTAQAASGHRRAWVMDVALVAARMRRSSASRRRLPDERADAVGGERQLGDLDAERGQRVGDGVGDRGGGADGAALGHALEAAHADRGRRLEV